MSDQEQEIPEGRVEWSMDPPRWPWKRRRTQHHAHNELVCGTCWAVVEYHHIRDHDRWHEQEAERVERLLLDRKRRAGIR